MTTTQNDLTAVTSAERTGVGLSPEAIEQLAAPLPLKEGHELRVQQELQDGARAQWLTYTTEEPIRLRLTEVDPNWSLTLSNVTVGEKFASVTVALTVCGVTRIGTGGASVKKTDQDTDHDVVKAASTDALKRAARMFGVGAYLLRAPKIYTDWARHERNQSTERRKEVYAIQDRARADAEAQFARWYNAQFGGKTQSPGEAAQEALDRLQDTLAGRGGGAEDYNPRRIPERREPPGGNGRNARPPSDDVLWSEKCASWQKDEWDKFWAEMKRRGLSSNDVHTALGVEHVKEFAGTYSDLNRVIKYASHLKKIGEAITGPLVKTPAQDAEPPQPPAPGKIGSFTLEGDEGSFTVARLSVRGVIGNPPDVQVFALNNDGQIDPMPALQHSASIKDLKQWFGASLPKTMPADWTPIYRMEDNDNVLLIAHWSRIDGQPRLTGVSWE